MKKSGYSKSTARKVEGASFRVIDEVRYIQRCAARHDSRIVTVGQLLFFSTGSGDAWVLDTEDHLAVRAAIDGDPLPVHVEETDTTIAIRWNGNYQIDGEAFIYGDHNLGRITTILGYSTRQIARQAITKSPKLFRSKL